jgi:hypothetical protein
LNPVENDGQPMPSITPERRRVGGDFTESVPAVQITDINIRFFSLMWLMVKFAFAAIPAAIIVAFVWAILWGLFAAFTGAGAIWHH